MTLPIDQAPLAPAPPAARHRAADAPARALEPGQLAVSVSPRLVTRLLLGVVTVLAVSGFAVVTAAYGLESAAVPADGRIRKLLDLDSEVNLPTWYQATMLALCAVVLLVIAGNQLRESGGRAAAPWAGLGALFGYLSLDEQISLHELAMPPLRAALGITDGILYYAWVVPGAAILVALAVVYIPFLRRLDAATRHRFVGAGALYVGGAFGLELLGGAFAGARGETDYAVKVIATVEETLEMVGTVLFLRALLLYVSRTAKGGAIVIARPGRGIERDASSTPAA